MSLIKPERDIRHRFIVYQYGKVGSTSVTETLNQVKGFEAHQTHFMGEEPLREIFDRLLDPNTQPYFFEHASGQLAENLSVYRYYLRREIDGTPLTILGLTREPFDWFRSAIAQDAIEHLNLLTEMLQRIGEPVGSESENMSRGLRLLFRRLVEAVAVFGDLDQMCAGARYPVLRAGLEHVDAEDFRVFMYFLNIFLRPHVWFDKHFTSVLGVSIRQMSALREDGLFSSLAWGKVFLLKYETLASGFDAVLDELGLQTPLPLLRRNVGNSKPFANEIAQAFASEEGRALKRLCHSSDTRFLGYPPLQE